MGGRRAAQSPSSHHARRARKLFCRGVTARALRSSARAPSPASASEEAPADNTAMNAGYAHVHAPRAPGHFARSLASRLHQTRPRPWLSGGDPALGSATARPAARPSGPTWRLQITRESSAACCWVVSMTRRAPGACRRTCAATSARAGVRRSNSARGRNTVHCRA